MKKTVAADIYTSEYYKQACQGHNLFAKTKGKILPKRLIMALEIANIQTGMTVLDIGSGRGEILFHAAQRGATAYGVDYAIPALQIAAEILSEVSQDLPITLYCGNAKNLPFLSDAFDRIFMLDLVEHLYPRELNRAFHEAYRLLKPNGQLIIHTMPNTWYYRFGYPFFRWIQSLRGHQLPTDPRDRWEFVSEVHVNEQNIISLNKALWQAGFQAKVWLKSAQNYSEESRIMQFLMHMSTVLYPFRWIFCNDLFAIARKIKPE